MKIQTSKDKPSNIAVGSARTCYSSRLIESHENEDWDRKNDLMIDLFKSGHHTTLQHSVFNFEISGISRMLIWKLLHSHSFYNSDQVSQRYAKIKPENDNFYYPSSMNKELIQEYYQKSFDAYEKIKELLIPVYEQSSNKVERKIASKKAMENARYVLPQAVKANLYHSINLTTALRYIASANILDECEEEAKELSKILQEKLLEEDPSYKILIDKVLKSIDKNHYIAPEVDLNEFPCIDQGYIKIFDTTPSYGLKNTNCYSQELMLHTVIHPNEMMGGFTSRIKLSLSADAQNQRHRTSPGVRPNLSKYYKENIENRDKNYYIPTVFFQCEEAMKVYREFLDYSEKFIELIDGDKKDLPYLIPNAFLIEIVERNDFSNFVHKAKMRTCHNAQEEIRMFTEEQIKKLKETNPEIVMHFAPPCVIRFRENIKPYCTEGSRFCGIKVWKMER